MAAGLGFVGTALLVATVMTASAGAKQTFVEEPRYQEVNPRGSVVMTCKVAEMQGECRWEKDSAPVGRFKNKYEWAGDVDAGDCSLRIIDANLEYDDGVWQCQVTPSSYQVKDSLMSEGAQLVVRESPTRVQIDKVGDEGQSVTASAGEDVELVCTVSGGNPPSKVRWLLRDEELHSGHTQEDVRAAKNARTWISTSRLTLPVSRADNGAVIRCLAEHPTLEAPLSTKTSLVIHYPPTVRIETSNLEHLEENKDGATLRCVADSNPPATILWRKEGHDGVFQAGGEISFSPVTRKTAGTYSCTAENALGMSKPSFVEVDVKYSPSILSVGPSKVVEARVSGRTTLTCEAEGNPKPRYQWLQKLPTQEVLIRGYERQLTLSNVSYDHQGEFVCKATNTLSSGDERSVQSEPIRVEVRGAPQVVRRFSGHAADEVRVQNGEDARLEVVFCADPIPRLAWHLGNVGVGSADHNILAAGTGNGRFVAESARKSTDGREDCYVSTLKINGAHSTDSHTYQLRLDNDHGSDLHTLNLVVRDHVSQESLIAVAVGAILTLLLLVLMIIYCCKSKTCCCSGSTGASDKKDFKPSDLESDRTDVESTHSSNLSGFPPAVGHTAGNIAAIPPDALYACSEKAAARRAMANSYHSYNHSNIHTESSMLNDSKESLKPDLISNLDRTQSTSSDLHVMRVGVGAASTSTFGTSPFGGGSVGMGMGTRPGSAAASHHHQPPRIVYNELCFPKTSNYGSMKKKKQRDNVQAQGQANSVGVSVGVTAGFPRNNNATYYS